MVLTHILKPLYHKLHIGTPLGINFRKIIEDIDYYSAFFVKPLRRFKYQKKPLLYTVSRYNNTWLNERTIEISIAKYVLQKHDNHNILEVGNVLQHYGLTGHTIVDKYEHGVNVINQDVINFNPQRAFTCIITISTLEHIGIDENPKNPDKALKALVHLQTLLTKDGELYATIPNGYHQKLSRWVIAYHKKNPEMVTFYEKIDHPFNKWCPTDQSIGFSVRSETIIKIAVIKLKKTTLIN